MPDPAPEPTGSKESQLAELLHAARAGSADDLGRLLEGCRPYLLLVANEELADDLQAKGGASVLVQETFLEAQLAFGRFRGDSERELLAWLRQILRHNLANFQRRYRQARRDVVREVSLEEADHLKARLEADASTPSGRAVRNEEAEALEQVLGRLPDDYRTVIVLRHR